MRKAYSICLNMYGLSGPLMKFDEVELMVIFAPDFPPAPCNLMTDAACIH